MKKTAWIIAVIITALMICLLFAGCSGENNVNTDSTADTSEATENPVSTDTADVPDTTEATEDTAGTTDGDFAETVAAPIEGLETVTEEISSKRLLMMSTRASKFLKSKLFGDTSLTWYKFYNACVNGQVDVASEDSIDYINECLAFFEENGLDEETTQANALLSAAEARK